MLTAVHCLAFVVAALIYDALGQKPGERIIQKGGNKIFNKNWANYVNLQYFSKLRTISFYSCN